MLYNPPLPIRNKCLKLAKCYEKCSHRYLNKLSTRIVTNIELAKFWEKNLTCYMICNQFLCTFLFISFGYYSNYFSLLILAVTFIFIFCIFCRGAILCERYLREIYSPEYFEKNKKIADEYTDQIVIPTLTRIFEIKGLADITSEYLGECEIYRQSYNIDILGS